jgi:hypothetical protein
MWITISLLIAAVFVAAALWLGSRKASLRWWEWTLGVAGWGLCMFTLQNYFASVAEFEPKAPGMFLLVFGLPALFLLLLGLALPGWRYLRAARRSNEQPSETAPASAET